MRYLCASLQYGHVCDSIRFLIPGFRKNVSRLFPVESCLQLFFRNGSLPSTVSLTNLLIYLNARAHAELIESIHKDLITLLTWTKISTHLFVADRSARNLPCRSWW
jgi:hypothetical protein